MKLAAAILLSSCAAFAQVDAPLLGYLPSQGQIRPIHGIPAAAIIGTPVAAGPFSQMAAAPDFVLASLRETGAVVLYKGGALTPVPAATASPDLIVLSPRATSAVLWYAAASQAQIVTGLGGTPTLRRVTAPFRPTVPALAISDDGEWLAGIWPAGVFVFGRDRQPAPIRFEYRARAIAFAAGAHDLALASSEGVFTLTGIAGSPVLSGVYTSPDATLRPAAISSANGTTVVATGESILRIGTGDPVSTECQCRPTELAPLGRGVYRVTGLAHGSALLYDTSTAAILYAPVSLSEGGAQ